MFEDGCLASSMATITFGGMPMLNHITMEVVVNVDLTIPIAVGVFRLISLTARRAPSK